MLTFDFELLFTNNVYCNSVLILATSQLYQTGLVLFSKVDLSKVTGTWEVPVVVL